MPVELEEKVRRLAERMSADLKREAIVAAIAANMGLTPEVVEDILAGRAYVSELRAEEREAAPVVHVASARLSFRQKVVAVLRARGGVGATSVAVGLAAALARDLKTLLCDFSFAEPVSDMAYYLGLDRRRDLPDLGLLGGDNLEECAVEADRNLYVLLPPRRAAPGDLEKAAAALEAARRDFDAVVADFPAVFDLPEEARPEPLERAARACNAAVAVTSGQPAELVRLAALVRRLEFRQVVLVANACSLPREAGDLFPGAALVRVEEDGQLSRSFERGELPREKGAFMKAMFAVKEALYEADRRSAVWARW
jgi:MinD-like ATPase involved in chromosome partitioning or flagellar assembly